jgi:hypothetical protein
VSGEAEEFVFEVVEGHLLQRGGEREHGHGGPPGREFVIAFRMAVGSDNSGAFRGTWRVLVTM